MAKKTGENFKITISDNFPVEKALRKFKRLCDSYGITKIYKEKESYSKPSVKAKEKREQAEKRRRKTQSKSASYRSKI